MPGLSSSNPQCSGDDDDMRELRRVEHAMSVVVLGGIIALASSPGRPFLLAVIRIMSRLRRVLIAAGGASSAFMNCNSVPFLSNSDSPT